MARAIPIKASEPRPYMVFNDNGFVDGYTSESGAEIFAREASKNGQRYTVFRLSKTTGMPRKCAEFKNGRRI